MGSKNIRLTLNINALTVTVCVYLLYKLKKENDELKAKLKETMFGG